MTSARANHSSRAANSSIADGADIDVNATVANGKTALYIACQNGHIEVVTQLLAANADTEKADA